METKTERVASKASTHIKVVIVEDHVMVAQGLCAVLDEEDGMEVTATTSTAQEAMEVMGHHAPEVALVDFRLRDGDGAELAAAVRRRHPQTRVVMLTAADDREVLARAIEAGAAGFVHKGGPIDEVIRAIRAVEADESWFRPEVLAQVVGTARQAAPVVGYDLTGREREVLACWLRAPPPRPSSTSWCSAPTPCATTCATS